MRLDGAGPRLWKEEREERRREEVETGSGAEPLRNFFKSAIYPTSRSRCGFLLAFLSSSHRDLSLGEVWGRSVSEKSIYFS